MSFFQNEIFSSSGTCTEGPLTHIGTTFDNLLWDSFGKGYFIVQMGPKERRERVKLRGKVRNIYNGQRNYAPFHVISSSKRQNLDQIIHAVKWYPWLKQKEYKNNNNICRSLKYLNIRVVEICLYDRCMAHTTLCLVYFKRGI